MKVSFTVEYDSGAATFDGLDGYYGASSLLGVNQLLLISLSAFLNKQVITQATSARGIRLVLRASKSGSWHQIIDLVTDPAVTGVLADLGKEALYDLLKYGCSSGIGLVHQFNNRKARLVLKELGKQDDDWEEKISEPLLRIHQPVKHQGLNVRLLAGRTEIIEFDEATLDYLESEVVAEDIISVEGAISRFNARTGTGRMILDMDAVSVPFTPDGLMSDTRKALLADNLAEVARNRFVPLTLYVRKVSANDGRLKSYILAGAA